MEEIIGVQDVTDIEIWRMLVAEFLGTFFLVVVGVFGTLQSNTVTAIGFAFGLTAAAMIQGIFHVSGGHINPAVTMSFLVVGEMSILKSILYMLLQCLGSIAAAGVLKLTVEGGDMVGITEPAGGLSDGKALCIEIIITFLLVFTVKSFTDPAREESKPYAPLGIGLAITAGHLAAVSVTGASMNPARSIGPAIFAGRYEAHWVYWLGPMLGAILAALIYKFIMRPASDGGGGGGDD